MQQLLAAAQQLLALRSSNTKEVLQPHVVRTADGTTVHT